MDIGKQLLQCLKYENSSTKIEELDERGLLEQIIPSIKDMKEVGKCKYHIVNAFQHSLYTLGHFESILQTERFFPSHLKEDIWNYLNSKDESGFPTLEILKLGVFLHDIGKPAAKTVDATGRTHFKGHDVTGGEIVLKLGKELGLFMFAEEGPGFPFFLPKGMTLKNTLIDYWREIHLREGYQEVSTPVILSRKLWETSGHWDHYKENMYTTVIDDEDYAIKPMNCPGGMLVYKSQPRSYRDLPLRVGELGLVHRHEKSGQLHGLMRVRCFTQDDAHIFMTQDQITDEIKGVTRLINEVYSQFGFDYFVELSTRPEDSMGSDEDWEMATNGLRNALDEMGLKYIVNEGDGAFYGPKIDFHLRDSIGRTWQCGTIQLDFQLPQRFEAEYVAEDGTKKRPIMIHRVCFGSIERFIGILIEHFAGKFPVWLAPVQVKVIPVSEKSMEYAQGVYDQLKAAGIRTELDRKDEKVGYKIRQAQLEKVPFMLVLGEKEAAEGKITVRSRDKGDLGVADLSTFIADVKKMTETREK